MSILSDSNSWKFTADMVDEARKRDASRKKEIAD